jgi:hypothetical protein
MGITFESNGNNFGQKENEKIGLNDWLVCSNKVNWTAFVAPIEIKSGPAHPKNQTLEKTK